MANNFEAKVTGSDVMLREKWHTFYTYQAKLVLTII
jgi:hypothetical protein